MPLQRIQDVSFIPSVNKYSVSVETDQVKVYDEQVITQVGTDKDYVAKNPDIVPITQTACTDTNTIWVSWTGNNANAGTEASPKRSFADDNYQSAGDGALKVAISAGFDICFVNGSTNMWVERVAIPKCITVYKKASVDTASLRHCKRFSSGPNYIELQNSDTYFIDPNVAGPGSGTWADPFKLFSSLPSSISRDNIVVFNSGVSGTPGDFTSLELTEIVDITDTVELATCLIKYGDDGSIGSNPGDTAYFTAGDTAIINYNGAKAVKLTNSATDTFYTSLTTDYTISSSYYNVIMYSDGSVAHSTDEYTYTHVTAGYTYTAGHDMENFNNATFISPGVKLYSTADFSTFTELSPSLTPIYRLKAFNSAIYAIGATVIKKSTDGVNFTTIASAGFVGDDGLKPVIFQGKMFFDGNGRTEFYSVDTSNNLVKLVLPDKFSRINMYNVLGDYLYLIVYDSVTKISYIYRYDGTSFVMLQALSSYTNSEIMGSVVYGNKIFYIHKGKVYSFDGTTNLLLGSIGMTTGTWARALSVSNEKIVMAYEDTGATRKAVTLRLFIFRLPAVIHGFELNGNASKYAFIGMLNATDNIQYCNITNCYYYCIKAVTTQILNNILSNAQYALKNGTTSYTNGNFISNITIQAIENLSGAMNIQYNTFDNCKYAIYNSGSTASTVAYNIFSRCGSNIYSPNIAIVPNNCVMTPRAVNSSNVVLDVESVTHNAIFRDADNGDYRLQAIGSTSATGLAYNADSAGVELGASITPSGKDSNGNAYSAMAKDAGCYEIVRPVYSDTWGTQVILNSVPNSLKITNVLKNKNSFQSKSGIVKQGYNGIKKRFDFTWSQENLQSYIKIYEYMNVLETNKVCKLRFNSSVDDSWTFVNSAGWVASTLRSDINTGAKGITSIGTKTKTRGDITFDLSEMTLTIASLLDTWVINQWRGFWVTMVDDTDMDGGATYSPRRHDFYIVSNTANTLTIRNDDDIDISGYADLTSTANDLCIIIETIRVRPDINQDFSATQQIFDNLNIHDSFPYSVDNTFTFEEV